MKTELTQDELDYIFQTEIRPSFDRKIARFPKATPTLVMVGAQPGAGKSRSMTKVLTEYPGAIPVIGDDFRQFHPDYRQLMLSPETALQMPQVTAQAAARWVEMSVEYLRERGAPVVLETTMRQPDVVASTMSSFREAGYYCEARVLAVPREVSLLGVVERYAHQVLENGAGRWTPVDMHDAAYNNLPQSLDKLAASGVVDRIVVTNRGGEVLYDTLRPYRDMPAIRQTIEQGRDFRALSPAQRTQWNVGLSKAQAVLVQTGEKNKDVLKTAKTLEANKKQTRETPQERAARRKEAAFKRDPEGARKALERLYGDEPPTRGLSR